MLIKKRHREFEVGNKVFLKVTPQQTWLKFDNSRNLSPRFCSLFEIIKQIGLVAYELNLFSSWKILNVFYVSLLQKYVSDPNYVLVELPKVALEAILFANQRRY